MSGETKAYNAGSKLDLNMLSGGSQSIANIGKNIFGEAGNQQVDPSRGGNNILMHPQHGGATKRRKLGKGKGKKAKHLGGASAKKSKRTATSSSTRRKKRRAKK